MATSYQDDYMKTALRLPRELHAKIQEAATVSGKSLNSELIARLEASLEDRFDLSHVVTRLERDLARAELEAESWRFRAGFVSEGLFALTDSMPPKARLPGNPKEMAAGEWRNFALAMVEQSKGAVGRLYQLRDHLKILEENDRAVEQGLPTVKITVRGKVVDTGIPDRTTRRAVLIDNASAPPPRTERRTLLDDEPTKRTPLKRRPVNKPKS